jgi:hypothetical protein
MGTRVDRDLARGRRAAAAMHRAGGSALQAVCAQIAVTFSAGRRHAMLKDRVALLMRRGLAHPSVWVRYRQFAECQPILDLDVTIMSIERMRRAEFEAQTAAIRAWGCCNRPRYTLMLLDELRLILRMLRRLAPLRYRDLAAAVLAADTHPPNQANPTTDRWELQS